MNSRLKKLQDETNRLMDPKDSSMRVTNSSAFRDADSSFKRSGSPSEMAHTMQGYSGKKGGFNEETFTESGVDKIEMNDFLQAEQSNVLYKPQVEGESLAMTLKKKRELETMLQQEREQAGFGYNTSSVPKKFKYTPSGRNEDDIVEGGN